MIWIFALVGLLLVFAVVAGVVGSEAFRLGHTTQAAIFDVDEAVLAVAEALPDDVQARLSYDEVRLLILATLEHLRTKGIGALPGEELAAAPGAAEVVVADDEAVAVVLGAVEAQGLDVTDEDAYVVIGALLTHLDEIGAVGPPA